MGDNTAAASLARAARKTERAQNSAVSARFGIEHEWTNNWNDYKQSAVDAVQTLRSLGVRAKLTYSSYQDHSQLAIHKEDLEKARRLAKDYPHLRKWVSRNP